MTAIRAIRLTGEDDVAVLCAAASEGDSIDAGGVRVIARGDIPAGHKIALAHLSEGQSVRKFGQTIGAARSAILPGDHVHTHNLSFIPAVRRPAAGRPQPPAAAPPRTFMGYARADGRVGTRNFVGVLTTVNCSATVARKIAERFPAHLFENDAACDGVVALTHSGGCGTPHEGVGVAMLERTLGGFARHPNFGGVLIVGLGCEVNQIERLLERQGLKRDARLRTLGIQDAGGARTAIEEGVRIVEELVARARTDRRSEQSAAHLVLALQCGGSDGWSGVTANPSLGRAADLLIAAGGAAILGETPEIYGAEDLLLRRAVDDGVAAKLIERLEWWESYAEVNGASLDNNPSPGNIKGGLTTILEKSLGAVAKSGAAPLTGVYQYAEPIDRPGLAFMDSPGYDPCSVTGEIASGANIVCFTTGRGSVFGSKPAPCLKLASNSTLARRQSDDIDIDCGPVAEAGVTTDEMGAVIFERILETASGRRTKSEDMGMGDLEFIPWYVGAAM